MRKTMRSSLLEWIVRENRAIQVAEEGVNLTNEWP